MINYRIFLPQVYFTQLHIHFLHCLSWVLTYVIPQMNLSPTIYMIPWNLYKEIKTLPHLKHALASFVVVSLLLSFFLLTVRSLLQGFGLWTFKIILENCYTCLVRCISGALMLTTIKWTPLDQVMDGYVVQIFVKIRARLQII